MSTLRQSLAPLGRLLARLGQHRRRISRVVLVLGVVVAVLELYPSFPRDTEVELLLGEERHQAVELRIAYVQDGEELQGVSFGFPAGAPARVRHTVNLPGGEFEVRVELRRGQGRALSWTRALHTPSQGTVRFRLDRAGMDISPRGGDA